MKNVLRIVALVAVSTIAIGSSARANVVNENVVEIAQKRDSMTIDLGPAQRVEVKLVMKKGQKAEYEWKTDGGEVTFNLHGEGPDAPGGKAHTYKRGSAANDKGEVVAVFDGVHGWSWRNAGDKAVKIRVTASGQFEQLKKM